jgi:hypothetical protein
MSILGINFWVLFLILSGIVIVITQLFNSKISIIRVLFGMLFVLLGTSIIVNGFGISGTTNNIIFSNQDISASDTANRYSVIFGNGTVDLSDRQPKDGNSRIAVDAIFGSATILIDKDTPIKIKGNTVFASMDLPDGDQDFINSKTYSQGDTSSQNCLNIEVNSIFSSVHIRQIDN